MLAPLARGLRHREIADGHAVRGIPVGMLAPLARGLRLEVVNHQVDTGARLHVGMLAPLARGLRLITFFVLSSWFQEGLVCWPRLLGD